MKPATLACAAAFLLMSASSIGIGTSVAQDASTGAVRGSILDTTGAGISGAAVTLTSIDSGRERTSTTDSQGGFSFDLLPPGEYSVRASLPKMAPHLRTGVQVDLDGSVHLTITLRIAAAQETVSVQAGSP